MGFGTELVFLLMLGLLVLGPKRLHTMLGQVARAKAEFDRASRELKSQLASELESVTAEGKNDDASIGAHAVGAPRH